MNCQPLVFPTFTEDSFRLKMSFVTVSKTPFSNYDFHKILQQHREKKNSLAHRIVGNYIVFTEPMNIRFQGSF